MSWKRNTKKLGLWLLAVFFVVAGLNHFVNPDFYAPMMPPFLPAHRALIFVSGVFEIAGGLALLVERWRRWVGLGLVILLIAVFPANIYMAIEGVQVTQEPAPEWALWLRLPVQFVFVAWVIVCTDLIRSETSA